MGDEGIDLDGLTFAKDCLDSTFNTNFDNWDLDLAKVDEVDEVFLLSIAPFDLTLTVVGFVSFLEGNLILPSSLEVVVLLVELPLLFKNPKE